MKATYNINFNRLETSTNCIPCVPECTNLMVDGGIYTEGKDYKCVIYHGKGEMAIPLPEGLAEIEEIKAAAKEHATILRTGKEIISYNKIKFNSFVSGVLWQKEENEKLIASFYSREEVMQILLHFINSVESEMPINDWMDEYYPVK